MQLVVRGFRNLAEMELEFSSDANYLFGPNAAGKTNLLEAVHYLAIGRSFRRSPDRELLGFGRECLVVSGRDSSGHSGEIRYDGAEKRILRDGVEMSRMSAYLGWLPVVAFLLDDIELVRGSPALRRGFLDLAIAKVDQDYIAALNRYRQALKQYNRLLEQGASADTRSAWEEELVRTGVELYEHRARVTGPLLAAAAGHAGVLLGSECAYEYRSSIGQGQPAAAADSALAERFRSRLEATRVRAEELRQAVVGPHRDDILIRYGERELRRFGSVGEQRLAAVALRLAEAELLRSYRDERPVFLLDEVVSELDEGRSRQVLALVTERGQVLYAAARRLGAPGMGERTEADICRDSSSTPAPFFAGKVFHVQAGKVTEVH